MNISVRIAGVPDEIRTDYLPNKNKEIYVCSKPVGRDNSECELGKKGKAIPVIGREGP
jgi:hypothetical protein